MFFKTTNFWQLAAGFITVALLLVVMGNIAIREVNTQAEFTEKMYLHPLTVSNLVLEANTNIIAMHRYMKDVVLARYKEDLDDAVSFISILKQMGFHFALNDFGSGLSWFGYLKSLPVDYLKIDGMFVKDMINDPIDFAMVKSINDIGQVMGLKTIAEFVENDHIKHMLAEIGVNYAQGYGTGKPQAFEEILAQSKL